MYTRIAFWNKSAKRAHEALHSFLRRLPAAEAGYIASEDTGTALWASSMRACAEEDEVAISETEHSLAAVGC